MLFAHVVPRKGLSHEHSAKELELGTKKSGYCEVRLNCDGEPVLKSVQEEVRRRLREEPTILENSGVGDSRSNGAAGRGVQAIREQVRVVKCGFESRLGVKLKGSHAVTCWFVENICGRAEQAQRWRRRTHTIRAAEGEDAEVVDPGSRGEGSLPGEVAGREARGALGGGILLWKVLEDGGGDRRE